MTKTLFALVLMASAALSQEKGPNCTSCGKEKYGTTVQWIGSPSDAAAKAKKEEKLVFVLHVSGYFEDPKFT
jgi:hypothetical protein